LRYGIGVGMGEMIAGKEFAENRKFKIDAKDSFSLKKLHCCMLITTVATR
jgi:hypothetical protein